MICSVLIALTLFDTVDLDFFELPLVVSELSLRSQGWRLRFTDNIPLVSLSLDEFNALLSEVAMF